MIRAALLSGALSLFLSSAQAASWDPDLEWHTLETEHFRITFHEEEEQLAEELSATAERIWDTLTVAMDYAPKRPVEIVLVDHTDSANGYATTLPINTIVIFVTAPTEDSTLGLYDDWLEAITTHELVHILHLDTVEGIPKLLRAILGRIVSINHVSPWWLVEGQATYMETRFTTGGRGRAPAANMVIRMAVLEDRFPELGQMDGWVSDPPGGNIRYLFGQSFMQYIADVAGEDAWTRWNHTYGAGIPYLLPARQVFGASFRSLYKDWKAELDQRYAAVKQTIEAQGATEFRLVSDGEDSCAGPAFSPDGTHLAYSCSDPRVGGAIWMADEHGENPEIEIENRGSKSLSWRADSKAFAYASARVHKRFNSYDDVWFHELGSESDQLLTRGKRARDPSFSPSGSDLYVVRNRVQDNNLYRLRIDQSLVPLTEYTDHTQLSTPRWHPNGEFVAMSVWTQGKRDIWVYNADGTPFRRISEDKHGDRDPTFSADGRWLFFSSDRTGIANLYAIDLQTEALWQVTNVLGGAFQPTIRPDFGLIAFQSYSSNGPDIAVMDLDPESWWPKGTLEPASEVNGSLHDLLDHEPLAPTAPTAEDSPSPSAELLVPVSEAETTEDNPDEDESAEPEEEAPYPFTHPVAPYNALRTLLPPRYIIPSLYKTTFGTMGALATGGMDTLRRYGYSAFLTYRTDSDALGGGGSITLNRWLPVFAAGGYSYTVPYGNILLNTPTLPGANIPGVEYSNERYWDRRIRIWTAASYPLRDSVSVSGRYSMTQRSELNPLPEDTYLPELPTRGVLSTLALGARYGKGKSFTYSISPEDGRYMALNAEWTAPWLGSYTLDSQENRQAFNQLQMTAELREFITNPWVPNHVLALRVAGGASAGDRLRYGSFRVGGSFGESGFYVLPDEYRPLRGFPVSSASGDWYYLGSAEYRLPLWRIDRGTGTIPAFFKTLHAALFTDVGSAFDNPENAPLPLVGVGAELRLIAILGWGIGLQGRLGYAFGLTGDGGYAPTDPETLYFRVGSSF
ncbi:MAG: hypothetical protein VX519_10385 [Myxococcota bacterium]|nr:hypothetical protein [Myxococcota bacterium]